jgi:molybdate transport system substrate-binding protein
MAKQAGKRESDWGVGLRVWIDCAGHTLLGPGRAALLDAVATHGSISGAARAIGMSYRHAWLLIQEINEASGEPLVEATTGGQHGGGARLTPKGNHALAVYHQLADRLNQSAASLMPRILEPQLDLSLHLVAAVSLEEVLGQLLADYAAVRPGIRIRTIFGASDELADSLLAGSPADLFLSADPRQLDRLQAASLIEADGRRDLAGNSLAAIGRADGPVVRTPETLVRQETIRIVIADPATPLGSYTRAYLSERGLFDKVLARATLVDNSRAVVLAVQRGRANAGMVYGSDVERADGCRVLFRVPQQFGDIRYAAAVLQHTPHADAARDLLAFLTSPAGAACFSRYGFLPTSA